MREKSFSSRFFLGGVCAIIGTRIGSLTTEEAAERLLKAGIKWVQYREKDKSRREIYMEAARLRKMTKDAGAVLVINDHADIALAVDADGVHLGQDDLPLKEARKIMRDRIIGISTHSIDEAAEAAGNGADYIGFGPVFDTDTKAAGTPRGVEMLRQVKLSTPLPVVAIGGINSINIRSVFDTGTDAVAIASALLKGDISTNARDLINAFQKKEGVQL